MTPLEILATIFALAILVKLLVIFINPASWLHISKSLLKQGAGATFLYFILMLIVGYYVFQSLDIVQVSAVMLFTALLMALTWIPYAKSLQKLGKEMLNKKTSVFSKNWLAVIIWIVLAVWALYTIFYV